jgi:toxin-antitoxin system PIN domain toxin
VNAVDTNILVHAHRKDSPWHSPARETVRALAEGADPWAIPWPCLHEFVGVVTHPKLFKPASTIAEAIEQVETWFEAPNLVLLSETGEYWRELRAILGQSLVAGPRVHDARIAALCRLHGVSELLTADRDFSRFPDLAVRNPLVAG